MKRFLLLALTVLCLTGCGKEVPSNQEQASEKNQFVLEDISEVRVSLEKNHVFTAPKDISTIVQALNQAFEMPGILNVAPSPLKLEVVNINGDVEVISLWLTEKEAKAMIMYETDTHTGYELLKVDREALWNLIYGN